MSLEPSIEIRNQRRRRRYRYRHRSTQEPNNSEQQQDNPRQYLKRIRRPYSLDDGNLAFLKQDLLQQQQHEESNYRTGGSCGQSMLDLLIKRERYSTFSRCHWQRQMLFQPNQQEAGKSYVRTTHSNTYRSWIKQKIPFTALETPISVAILALEANSGSYALGLLQSAFADTSCMYGDSSKNEHSMLHFVPSTVTLNLYGLPSCNSFAQKRRFDLQQRNQTRGHKPNNSLVAPKLMAIPLAFDDDDDHDFSLIHNSSMNSVLPERPFGGPPERRRRIPWDEEPLEHLYGQKLSKCVDLCISRDWRVGVAIVWMPRTLLSRTMGHDQEAPSTTTRMASIVLFPLGTDISNQSQSAHTFISVLRATPVPVSSKFGIRNGGCNLFWKIEQIPQTSRPNTTSWEIARICNIPAYLLLIDDAEGYRIVWVSESAWQMNHSDFVDGGSSGGLFEPAVMHVHNPTSPCITWRTPSRPILVPISTAEPPYWKERWSDRQSGAAWVPSDDDEDHDNVREHKGSDSKSPTGKIHIAQECQFLILSLLLDVLERRPSLQSAATLHHQGFRSRVECKDEQSSVYIPDYAYELVSISHAGRLAKLVLGFPTTRTTVWQNMSASDETVAGKTAPLPSQYVAVLLAVDLWTQRYSEIKWVKIPIVSDTARTPYSHDLSKRIQKLAVEFRIQELATCCSSLKHRGKQPDQRQPRRNSSDHQQTSYQPSAGGEENEPGISRERCNGISSASLYPDCDTFSNRNVLRGFPIMSIASRSPVELIYG